MDKNNAIEIRNMTKHFKVEYDKPHTLKERLLSIGKSSEEVHTVLKNINLVKISNREEVDKIIDVTKDCIHVNRALKLYDSESIIIFNYALRRMLKENYFVVSLFLEQYYYWGIKGLLRILKWGWLFNFGYARKLKALGCCGRTGIEAHRKAFVSRKKLFDFVGYWLMDFCFIDEKYYVLFSFQTEVFAKNVHIF